MTKELITVDTILEALQGWVENKQPIDASTWLDASAKLTVLVGEVQSELFLLEQGIAQKKLNYINEYGDSVAKTKLRAEATDEYVQARNLEAKIDRVTELVRISKLQARMSDDNLRNH